MRIRSMCASSCLSHREQGDTERGNARGQHGFTLVETIISVGLISLLALTATFFWVQNFELVRTVNADSAAMADARALLERLSREIRETKFDPTAGAYCVSTMTATQMVFN